MSIVLSANADGAVVPDREEREIQSLISSSSTLGCPLFCNVLFTGVTVQCAGHWSYCPVCCSLELLPSVLVTGVTAQCAGQWSYGPVCWTLELLPSVLVTGVTVQCAGHWSYCPMCWSVDLLPTVVVTVVTSHFAGHCSYCPLWVGLVLIMVIFRYSLFMMNWIISFCVLLNSTCHVTACWLWSRFNK